MLPRQTPGSLVHPLTSHPAPSSASGPEIAGLPSPCESPRSAVTWEGRAQGSSLCVLFRNSTNPPGLRWLRGLGVIPERERSPVRSSQGTGLGCRFGPWLCVYKRQLIDVSLSHWCSPPSLFPSLALSRKSINKIFFFLKKDTNFIPEDSTCVT